MSTNAFKVYLHSLEGKRAREHLAGKLCLLVQHTALNLAGLFLVATEKSSLLSISSSTQSIVVILPGLLVRRPATIHFSTIRYVSRYSCHNTIHDTIRYITTKHRVLLLGSEVCTADKPSWKHTCLLCPPS